VQELRDMAYLFIMEQSLLLKGGSFSRYGWLRQPQASWG
jgi:hypothetical protein